MEYQPNRHVIEVPEQRRKKSRTRKKYFNKSGKNFSKQHKNYKPTDSKTSTNPEQNNCKERNLKVYL